MIRELREGRAEKKRSRLDRGGCAH